MKKRYIFCLLLIVVVVLGILFFSEKGYSYSDNYAPLTNYKIKINNFTKVMEGEFYHSCSTKDCNNKTNKYSIKLTNDEYKKIMKLWNDKETLSPILEELCKDDKVFYESFVDSYEFSQTDYNKMDKNSDGKITSREFANQMLIDVLNEN